MLQITSIREVNYKISQESINLLLEDENRQNLMDYINTASLVKVIKYIIDDFEEEVKIGTIIDINDYIEYFLERIREIY